MIFSLILQQQHLPVWVSLSRGLGRSNCKHPCLYRHSYP